MSKQKDRWVQSYRECGDRAKSIYCPEWLWNDNRILLDTVTRFVDAYQIQTLYFMKYKGFNGVKVTRKDGSIFYATVEPSEEIAIETQEH